VPAMGMEVVAILAVCLIFFLLVLQLAVHSAFLVALQLLELRVRPLLLSAL